MNLSKKIVTAFAAMVASVSLAAESDYVTMLLSDPDSGKPSTYVQCAYYGAAGWAGGQAPDAAHDYLVGRDKIILFPVSWAFLQDSGRTNPNHNAFYGRSLTIDKGGAIRTDGYNEGSATYAFEVTNLIMNAGSRIYSKENAGCRFSAATTMTINGTEDDPVTIEVGTKNDVFIPTFVSDGITYENEAQRFRFANKFVGDWEKVIKVTTLFPDHQTVWYKTDFAGDMSGFEGTIYVDSMRDTILIGKDGIPAGALVFNPDEEGKTTTRLGASDTSSAGMMIPLNVLQVPAGFTIDCASIIKNNHGCGFEIWGDFSHDGKVKLDFGNVPVTFSKTPLLSVPETSGEVRVEDFEVVNFDMTGFTLDVEYNLGFYRLVLLNENGEPAETIALQISELDQNITDPGKYAFYSQYGYQGYESGGDLRQAWADGMAPQAGHDYIIPNGKQMQLHVTAAFRDEVGLKFAGDSLTIAKGGRLFSQGIWSSNPKELTVDINLWLQNGSVIYMWHASRLALGGTMHVTGTIDDPAQLQMGPVNPRQYYHVYSKLLGETGSALKILEYADPKPEFQPGVGFNYAEFSGDCSNYKGSIVLDPNAALFLGNSGLPKGAVNVASEYAGLGMVADKGEQLVIDSLEFANNATLFCAGIVTNRAGFKVTSFYSQGQKLKLDFGGITRGKGDKKLVLMTVPGNNMFTPDSFEVKNLALAGYTLGVENGAGVTRVFIENPEAEPVENYITLLGNDPWSSTVCQSSFLTNVATAGWSDHLAPHAGGKYLVDNGLTLRMPHNAQPTSVFAGDSLTIDGGYFRHENWSDDAPYGKSHTITINDLIVKKGMISLGCASPTTYYGKLTFNSKIYNYAENTIWYYTWTGQHENHMKIVSGEKDRVLFTSGATAKNGSPTYPTPGDGSTTHTSGKYSWSMYNGSVIYHLMGDCSGFLGTAVGDWGTYFDYDSTYKFGGTFEIKNASQLQIGSTVKSGVKIKAVVSRDADVYVYGGASATIDTLDTSYAAVDSHVYNGVDVYTGKHLVTPYVPSHKTQKSAYSDKEIPINRICVQKDASLHIGTLIARDTKFELNGGTLEVDNLQIGGNIEWPTGAHGVKINGTLTMLDGGKLKVAPVEGQRFTRIFELGPAAQVDESMFELPDFGNRADQFRFVIDKTAGSVYIEDMACQEANSYDVYQTRSDYRCCVKDGDVQTSPDGNLIEGYTWVSSFVDPYNWSDGKAPHAGASYAFANRALHVIKGGAYEFGGDLLAIVGSTAGETLLRCDPNAELTVRELRFIGNGTFFSAGGKSIVFNGETMRILSSAATPTLFRFNQNGSVCTVNMKLVGGKARFISTRTESAPGTSRHDLVFAGDTSEFAGTMVVSNNFVLTIGDSGMPKGTVRLINGSTGFRTMGEKRVDLGAFVAADGARIYCDANPKGFRAKALTFEGAAILDFGASPAAKRIEVFSVPDTEEIRLGNFAVATPFVGYQLSVEDKDGYLTLVYEKPAKPLSIILR